VLKIVVSTNQTELAISGILAFAFNIGYKFKAFRSIVTKLLETIRDNIHSTIILTIIHNSKLREIPENNKQLQSSFSRKIP
jgi:hypothetical protein